MRAYGKDRCYCVATRVRRPYRGGKGCPCCGAVAEAEKGRKVKHKKRARAQAKKEVQESAAV